MPLFLLLTACSGLQDASAVALDAETPVAPAASHPTTEPAVAVAAAVDWVTLDKDAGELDAQLATYAAQAHADGKIPVAYLGARWCGPCKAFKMQKGDPSIVQALDGVRIIELDVDQFVAGLEPAGVQVVAIPHWFVLDAQGDPINGGMSGDKWTDLSPASMAPSLASLKQPPATL
ncbi:MAG: thiol:disulfide interchange protein [Cognaticolwellia sp.]